MRYPEEELITILKQSGVDLVCTLPCDRVKRLIALLPTAYSPPLQHIPLTREEEGVGICAGAALAGKRAAIILQNSGIGNMINALLSLTGFYQLPLALFVSHRGIYKEKIAAQMPMGEKLPGILKGAGIGYSLINTPADLNSIGKKLTALYRNNSIHAFLLSPEVWEDTTVCSDTAAAQAPPVLCAARSKKAEREYLGADIGSRRLKPVFTRFEVLET